VACRTEHWHPACSNGQGSPRKLGSLGRRSLTPAVQQGTRSVHACDAGMLRLVVLGVHSGGGRTLRVCRNACAPMKLLGCLRA
jgi:hypothetical protein